MAKSTGALWLIIMSLENYLEHEKIVNALFIRLKASNRYTSIQKHVNYGIRNHHGEADIIASNDSSTHYYEVKIHCNESSKYKAIKQFKRFDICNPLLHAKYIYFTPNFVKRVRLESL